MIPAPFIENPISFIDALRLSDVVLVNIGSIPANDIKRLAGFLISGKTGWKLEDPTYQLLRKIYCFPLRASPEEIEMLAGNVSRQIQLASEEEYNDSSDSGC